MGDDLASRFRAFYEAGTPAFNRGDLDQALAAMPDDLEWHASGEFVDRTVHRGPTEIKGWFAEMRSIFDDWRVEVQEAEQVSDDAVLVFHVIHGVSRAAGVPVEVRTFELWEFVPLAPGTHRAWEFVGMRPVRVRQFSTREEALAALD